MTWAELVRAKDAALDEYLDSMIGVTTVRDWNLSQAAELNYEWWRSLVDNYER